MLLGPSFRSALVFSIKPLILSDFSLTSFHLAEASLLYLLLRGFILLCVQLLKNIKKCLLFIIIHNQPVLFAQHKNVNKLRSNNCIMHMNKRNGNNSKQSHVLFQLTLRSIVRFSKTMQRYH